MENAAVAPGFYDLVALGLTLYARASFRVQRVGARFALDPGGLVVSSHRSDADVPVLISAIYREAHGFVRTGRQLHFAVRDDLYLRGFFGGYPASLSERTRRLLFRVGIGGILRPLLPCCHPIRSASRMRLVELLRAHPDTPLAELLPEELARPFHERGLRSAATARDALGGRYADLLWRVADADELTGPLAEESWRRRALLAAADFRTLAAILRRGGTLLVFPEGRPSPDGGLGPLQRGLEALVRRGRPETVRAAAFAYDPLVAGRRPLAYVGIGEPGPPIADDREMLALLRRTTPLTAGQLVATGAGVEEIDAALAEGRPVAPELIDPKGRRRRLEEARAAAAGRNLDRLAVEFRSARV
jgi:1-acyl-sn-glycerol-3-phosphate acyltransferase